MMQGERTLVLKRGLVRQRNIHIVIAFLFVLALVSIGITQLTKAYAVGSSEIGYFCWGALFTLILVALFSGKLRNRNERILVTASWAIRFVHVTAMKFGLYYVTLSGDEIGFVNVANGYFDGSGAGDYYTNMPIVMNSFYQVMGKDNWTFSLFNSFLAMLAVYFIILSLDQLEISGKVRTVVLIIAALNPVGIILCSVPLREAIYLCLSAFSLYLVILWAYRKKERYMISAIILTLPMVWLHTGNIAITGAYCLVWMFISVRRTLSEKIYKCMLFLLVAAAGIALLSSKHIPYVGSFGGIGNVLDKVVDLYNNSYNYMGYSSGSTVLGWMTSVSGPGQFLLFTPFRMMEFLFSPMPWDCYRIRDIVGMLGDGLIYFVAMVIYFIGLHRLKKVHINRKTDNREYHIICICIVLAALLMALIFGWGTITSGTALRHRNCLIPEVCLLIGISAKRILKAADRKRSILKA